MVSTQRGFDLLTRRTFFQQTSAFFSESQCGSCFLLLTLCSCLGAGARRCICPCSTSTFNLWVNLLYFCTLSTHCPILELLHCATAELHCRATAPAVTPSLPPTEERVPQCDTHTRPVCVGKFCFFFYNRIFGCSFLPAGSTPQWEGGVASAPCVLQVRVLFLLASSGDAQKSFM